MRIFLIRHGFSEGNEDPANYILRGDPLVELTDTGWQQAIAAGEFLSDYFKQNPGTSPRAPRLWMSSYKRTRQTASGLVYGAQGLIDPKECRVSSHLVEQSFGLFSQIQTPEDRKKLFPIHNEFYERARKDYKYYAKMPMGESPMEVQSRVSDIIGTIMRDKDKKGIEDVVIVTHGVTLRAFVMEFLKLDPDVYKDFKNPENCSMYVIEGESDKGYTFRQVYNGKEQKAVNIDWGKKLGVDGLVLPDVPEKFKRGAPKPPSP